MNKSSRSSLLREQWRDMHVNLFPLASLLDQYRCALRIDLLGSAIRQGLRPHHVARSNGG